MKPICPDPENELTPGPKPFVYHYKDERDTIYGKQSIFYMLI